MNKKIFIMALLCAPLVAACYQEPAKPELPKIALSSTEKVLFDAKAGEGAVLSANLTLTVNRDWSIQCDADWLAFGQYAGGQVYKVAAGVDTEIPVKIVAQTNRVGNVRRATVRFKTSTDYIDLAVEQKMNEDGAPSLIYYNSFGASSSNNPEVQTTNVWRCEEGVAGDVRYYMGTGAISVRTTTDSEGCYVGASGGNNLFFGKEAPAFAIAEIDVHPKLSMLIIGFGAIYADGSLALSDLPLHISCDGQTWLPLEYKKVSEFDEPKWCWCEGEFHFTPGSFEHLYIMLDPDSDLASSFRLDDVKISSDLSAEPGTLINWSAGSAMSLPGKEILKK